ncbi:MAG: hypothetical protein FWH01_11835 [Oscillospiraceae bacterium]|nr:hypothetical protein [Oscillospiraceae bacterium]
MDVNYADFFYQSSLRATVSRYSVLNAMGCAGLSCAVNEPAASTASSPATASSATSTASAAAPSRDCVASPAFARWRSDLSRDFLSCLGGTPWRCPLSIRRGNPIKLTASALDEVGYKSDTGGAGKREYTRERIMFDAEAGLTTPAYLLVPEGADTSTPTAVALAGHGFGVADIVGLTPGGDEQTPGGSGYHKAFAVALAQRGFVVIAPELLGFGELKLERDIDPKNPGSSSCNAISSMLLMIGRTMAGVRVNQARRCIDVLAELGYGMSPVAMGISGGGLVCAYTTALEERVRACCVSGFANTYRGCILAMHHCVDNYQPNLLLTADMPDILSLIAPRPMLWESGEHDPIFPIANVVEAEAIVRRVYDAYGRSGDFILDRFDDEHVIHGVKSYDFLWDHATKS